MLKKSSSEKISKVRKRLYEWMISDIKRAAHLKNDCSGYFDEGGRNKIKKLIPDYDGGSMIGGFVLSLQAIQVLSKLAHNKSDINAFNNFVKKFMPVYSQFNLYELRNALFKQYTAKASSRGLLITNFALWSRNPKVHLKNQGGHYNLNLENFVADVEGAFNHFFSNGAKGVEKRIEKYYDEFLMNAVGAVSSAPHL